MDTGLQVLVVEDSAQIRRRLVERLSELGGVARVAEADGIVPARQLMACAHVDLVVLDIRMPGGSGLELLREIKRGGPSPLVVILTNVSTEPYRRACLQAGADAFLDKAMGLEPLVEIVRGVAGRSEGVCGHQSRG